MVKYWLRIAGCWDTPTLVRDAYALAQSNCIQWTLNIKTVMLLICVGPPRMCRARKNYIWNRAAANWPIYTEQDKWTSGIDWKIEDIQTYQAKLQNGKLPRASTPSLSASCTAKNKFPPSENWSRKIQPITSRRAGFVIMEQ